MINSLHKHFWLKALILGASTLELPNIPNHIGSTQLLYSFKFSEAKILKDSVA